MRAVITLASTLAMLLAGSLPAAAAPPPVRYAPPVDAPVSEPFRPPAGPYGPGNRGVDYDVAAATAVRSIGDGEVTFAGQVGGSLHVTVAHADGLRSTYSFLASISLRRGARVRRGDTIGTASGRFHLGVRAHGYYVDPEPLFETEPRVRLVPLGDPTHGQVDDVTAIWHAIRDRGGGVLDRVGGAIDWLGDGSVRVASAAQSVAVRRLLRAGVFVYELATIALHDDVDCSNGPPPPAPRDRRIALLVAGFGSTSDDGSVDDVDTAALGYAPGDVLRFSYAGGRVPDDTDVFTSIAAHPYSSGDSQGDIRAAGVRLADLIVEVTRAAPDVTIDLIAHSQGGLVVRIALDELVVRGRLPAQIDLVATMGTPHHGAVLADGIAEAAASPITGVALDVVGDRIGLEEDSVAVRQLIPGSQLLRSISPRLPPSVRGLSIAARSDVIVPAWSSSLAGMRHVVVAGGVNGHSGVPSAPGTRDALARAIAGLRPACEGKLERFADLLLSELSTVTSEGASLGLDMVAGPG